MIQFLPSSGMTYSMTSSGNDDDDSEHADDVDDLYDPLLWNGPRSRRFRTILLNTVP